MRARSNHFVWVLPLLAVFVLCGATGLSAAEAAKAVKAAKPFQWGPFLAPFHPVVLHYPIGFITMACILEIYSLRRPSPELRQITRLVILLSLLSGIVAAGFGILRAQDGGYDHATLERHRWFGLAIPAFTVLALWLKGASIKNGTSRGLLYGYRASLLLTLVTLVIAGHQGGNLTHGSNYLTANAPEFVKDFLAEETTVDAGSSEAAAGTNNPDDVYSSKIRPILEAKCYQCHNAEKHKGEYRLDKKEIAYKGGESEKTAIKPGAPLESNLVRLILLPAGDDDAMPPSGKEGLTPEETLTIIHWIQSGAPFPE